MTMRDRVHRPEEFSSFIGRGSEVGEIRELMRVVRAVTLCGAGRSEERRVGKECRP